MAALVVLSAAMIESRLWLSGAALVMLVAGAGAGIRGGIFADARSAAGARQELHDVVHGRVRRGTDAGDMHTGLESREEARAASTRARTAVGLTRRMPAPPLGSLCGMLLLVAGGFAVCLQAAYPFTPLGQRNGLHELGPAIVVVLAGLRFVISEARHLVAATAAALAGGILIAVGLVARHDTSMMPVLETVTGVWILIVAVVGGVSSARSVTRVGADPRSDDRIAMRR